MAGIAQIKEVTTAPTFPVTFPSTFTTTPVVIAEFYKSASNPDSIGGNIVQSSISTTGFNVENLVETGYMRYIAYDSTSDDTSVVTVSDRLSRDFTAMRAWLRVFTDVKPDTVVFEYEALRMINDIAPRIAAAFFEKYGSRYETRATGVAITSAVVDLSAYRIASAEHLKLEFAETNYTRYINPNDSALAHQTLSQYVRTSSQHNKNTIFYTTEGDNMRLAYGSGVTTPTTVTLVYPRIPTEVVIWSDKIDIPDGEPMQMFLAELEKGVKKRWGTA